MLLSSCSAVSDNLNVFFGPHINTQVCYLNQQVGQDTSQAWYGAINYTGSKLLFISAYFAFFSGFWNVAFMSNRQCEIVNSVCQLVSLSHTYFELMLPKKTTWHPQSQMSGLQCYCSLLQELKGRTASTIFSRINWRNWHTCAYTAKINELQTIHYRFTRCFKAYRITIADLQFSLEMMI